MSQADIYEVPTRRFFEDAGIRPGMKVLDVGSGAGDVSFLIADMVAPDGRVVGIDRDLKILAAARSRAEQGRRDTVVFHEGDIHTAELDHNFDAVVGRFVLMHTPDVEGLLRRVLSLVRPGGLVAFAEGDMAIGAAYARIGPPGLPGRLWDWTLEVCERVGVHISMAPVLCRAFAAAGLGEPHMFLQAPLGCREDWPGYRMDAEAMRSILPLLERFNIADAQEVDVDTLARRYHADVLDTGVPFMLLPMVTAWARKP